MEKEPNKESADRWTVENNDRLRGLRQKQIEGSINETESQELVGLATKKEGVENTPLTEVEEKKYFELSAKQTREPKEMTTAEEAELFDLSFRRQKKVA